MTLVRVRAVVTTGCFRSRLRSRTGVSITMCVSIIFITSLPEWMFYHNPAHLHRSSHELLVSDKDQQQFYFQYEILPFKRISQT